MGFLNRMKLNRLISPHDAFRLTQVGREKLQQSYTGNPKGRIWVALESEGSLNIEELSQNTGLNRDLIERVLPSCLKEGTIQRVNTTMGEFD